MLSPQRVEKPRHAEQTSPKAKSRAVSSMGTARFYNR